MFPYSSLFNTVTLYAGVILSKNTNSILDSLCLALHNRQGMLLLMSAPSKLATVRVTVCSKCFRFLESCVYLCQVLYSCYNFLYHHKLHHSCEAVDWLLFASWYQERESQRGFLWKERKLLQSSLFPLLSFFKSVHLSMRFMEYGFVPWLTHEFKYVIFRFPEFWDQCQQIIHVYIETFRHSAMIYS